MGTRGVEEAAGSGCCFPWGAAAAAARNVDGKKAAEDCSLSGVALGDQDGAKEAPLFFLNLDLY